MQTQKLRPHYPLEELKELFKDENTRIVTNTALKNAVSLGYTNEEDILAVIADLKNSHLYKAMTCEWNDEMWQDVYKITDEHDNTIYIKLQLSEDKEKAVLIQFKKDTGDER